MKRMSLYKMICYCCLIWGTMACTKEDTPEAMWEYDYGYQTIEMIRIQGLCLPSWTVLPKRRKCVMPFIRSTIYIFTII